MRYDIHLLQNRRLADQILEQSVILTEEVQTELSARSNALEKYKNVSEDHANALKHKTEYDRIAFSTLVNVCSIIKIMEII